jgi:hypothetical protein
LIKASLEEYLALEFFLLPISAQGLVVINFRFYAKNVLKEEKKFIHKNDRTVMPN